MRIRTRVVLSRSVTNIGVGTWNDATLILKSKSSDDTPLGERLFDPIHGVQC
jgi:hypothetical protein